jgi:hypothetical protein
MGSHRRLRRPSLWHIPTLLLRVVSSPFNKKKQKLKPIQDKKDSLLKKGSNLGCFQILAVLFGRKSHGFHGLIAQLQAKLDALIECLHGIESGVHIGEISRLNVAGFVVDVRLDDTVANRFGHNELGVDGRVQLQLLCYVVQGDFRIGQGHHFHARFDHIMSQSKHDRTN